MNAEAEIGAMVIFFLLGLIVGQVMVSDQFPLWISQLSVPLTTLVAAYVGAKYAFSLNEKKEKGRKESEDVSAGNKAIFELIRAYNKFQTTKNQFISPAIDSEYRAFEILPIIGSLGGYEPRCTDYISYLLDSDDPALVQEIAQLESEIIMTLEIIAERSSTHLNEVQRQLDLKGVTHDVILDMDELKKLLGERVVTTMIMATDQMIESIDSVIDACLRLIPRLNNILVRRYPNHKIIKMEFPRN